MRRLMVGLQPLSRRRQEQRFASAGLLSGLLGEARSNRIAVLRTLTDDGIAISELVSATGQGQLAHLVLENALTSRGPMRTLAEISSLTGLPLSDVTTWFRAFGRGVSSTTSAADYGDDDLKLAFLLAEYRQLGFDETSLFASIRVIGRNIWTIADAAQPLLVERLSAARDEPELALRYAHEIKRFAEFQTQVLANVLATYLRNEMRTDVGTDANAPNAQEISVCFADLVGFTTLGEQVSPADLGRLAQQLDILTTEIVSAPVRFVKTVGDAVMLISPEPTALALTAVKLVAAADAAGLPPIHAGIATGTAVPSAGDWIGRPVNLASRIVTVASAQTVLVDESVHQALNSTELSSVPAGAFDFKGFAHPVELFRIRASDPT